MGQRKIQVSMKTCIKFLYSTNLKYQGVKTKNFVIMLFTTKIIIICIKLQIQLCVGIK